MGLIQITLMRHAHSRADDEGVHEGRYDSPLTDRGQAQIQTRAAAWQAGGVMFDAIIASPLVRAHESAQIIGRTLAVPVETDPRWMEFDNAPLAGLSYAEALERYPWPAFRTPYEAFFDVGESDWDLQIRAIQGLQAVVRRGPGRYLVVAHGAILNAALRHIIGTAPAPNWNHGVVFAFGDGGYACWTYDSGLHQWTLREFHAGEFVSPP
jgi:2,3-bisphosphoglycerate-dependent phosphoglycerate mutase